MRVTAALALTVAAATSFGLPRTAGAKPYEAFIDVESEDDLYDLLATEQISQETFDALDTLLSRGVDLDRAPRDEIYALPNLDYDDVDAILAYRATQGYVGDPANLVSSGTLTDEKLLAISSFLIVHGRDKSPWQPRGWFRAATRAASGDDRVPPMQLRARAFVGRRLSAGLAASLTRLRIGAPVWDPNRDGLIADDASTQLNVPKFYVRYRGDHFDLIAGTYRVGFGERLTFDNSSDPTPDGIYADDQLTHGGELARRCRTSQGELSASMCSGDYHYVTPDYKWSQGLRGVAAGSDHILVGSGYMEAYAFGGYTTKSIYQYEVVNRAICSDPRNDKDPRCAAPPVYVRPDGDPLTPTAEHSYQTLPDAFVESLVGGNLTFHARKRDYVGVTGYGATTNWLIDTPDGVTLDTQEWSQTPTGGRYGAIGANIGIGRGLFDIFAEATYSFDNLPPPAPLVVNGVAVQNPIDGGGGPAAIVRVTRTERHRVFEASLRYYDPDFVNPYAGSSTTSDEVEGQRVRGEHGLRVRYSDTRGALTLHGSLDLWRALANTEDKQTSYAYVPKVDAAVRGDLEASEQLSYGLGLRFEDKDLGNASIGGHDECYSVVFEDDQNGEPVACRGSKLSTTGRLRYQANRQTTLTGSVSYSLLDDRHKQDAPRQDVSALATVAWKPQPRLRLRARIRYLNQDIPDSAYLITSVATYVEANLKLRKKDTVQVRADLIKYLDDRASTALRVPSPEVWLSALYLVNY